MIRVRKLQIYPNKKQINHINEILGCCNWIKNKYLEVNIRRYENGKSFVDAYTFSKFINFLKKHYDDFKWIKKYSSKAIQEAMQSKEKAYKRFFKTNEGFPRFKSRKRINKESFFFIKDNIHYIKKNVIQLPILGKVRITENDYLPELSSITSGRIIREYNKYYVMLIVKEDKCELDTSSLELGIDVGVKNYATISSNYLESKIITHFKDIERYKEYDKRIIKLQQILSHKVEVNYNRLLNKYMDTNPDKEISEKIKNIMKGESYNSSRIRGLRRKINNLNRKKQNIRTDFINKLVYSLTARTKPSMITIENLVIKEMIKHNGTKDTTLHKYIAESGFYTFKTKLINACEYYGIKLRLANKYFASSKRCCVCGHKKKDLTLNDRVYHCTSCGNKIDRDLNASINLLHLKDKDTDIVNA